MFEAYTLLGALAMQTTSARLLALVSPVTLRNPALLAKCVTTLDVLSRGPGRARRGRRLGRGRARGLRAALPGTGERMDRLDDALAVCRAMFAAAARHRQRHVLLGHTTPRTPPAPPAPSRSWSAGAASAAPWTWPPGTPTRATSSAIRRRPGTSSTCSNGTASGSGRDPAEITKTVFASPPDDLAEFAARADALAAVGADGMIVIGPDDPSQIPALGQILAEAFPD